MWLLGTFVNSSCDINIKIVQNCCRDLAVGGLMCKRVSILQLYLCCF